MMNFGTSKQRFAKTSQFLDKRRPEACRVEFVETKQVTVVRAFFYLLASAICLFFTPGFPPKVPFVNVPPH